MDCTGLAGKWKRFCFQHLLQNRKRSVFQANYIDLLHWPITFPHLTLIKIINMIYYIDLLHFRISAYRYIVQANQYDLLH